MIDLAALTSLRAVATHGSVVGAADALGFTPSAVSQQVKRLEKQTGVPLLERVGRGVILTDHGRHLVDAGGRLLADLAQVEASLHPGGGRVRPHRGAARGARAPWGPPRPRRCCAGEWPPSPAPSPPPPPPARPP